MFAKLSALTCTRTPSTAKTEASPVARLHLRLVAGDHEDRDPEVAKRRDEEPG